MRHAPARFLLVFLASLTTGGPATAADPSRTEIARALLDAPPGSAVALADSLTARFPAYGADVTVILHRMAVDDSARATDALEAARVWGAAARRRGDALPASIHTRFLTWDDRAARRWREGEESYRNGARALQSLSYEEAETALLHAIDIFQEVGDGYRLGLALSYLGLSGLNRGEWNLAIRSLAAADSVQKAVGDVAHRAATLSYRAQIQEAFGDYEGALAQQEESLALFRSLGSRLDIAETLQAAAHILAVQARHREAKRYLDEALAIHESLANPVGSSQAEIALGNLAVRFGDFAIAAERYERALRTIDEHDLAPLRSELLHARGILAGTRGRHEEAARFYAEAARADSALGNLHGLAYARIGQSISLLETGRYDRALPLAHEVRAWAREAGMPAVERLAWETIGRFSLRMNDMPQAKRAFEEAHDLAKSSGEVVAEAENLLALARVRSEIGEPGAADDFYDAIAIFDRWEQIAAREEAVLECAMALLREDRFPEAEELLRQDDSDRPERVYARALLALETGRPDDALSLLGDRATGESGRRAVRSPWEWRFADLRARALARTGRDEDAIEELRIAVDRIETLRARVTVVSNRGSFLDDKMPLYRQYVKRLLSRGRTDEAFVVMQRAKGRTFRDLLNAAPERGSSDSLSAKLTALERKITHLEQRWIEADAAGLATEAGNFAREYERALADHEALWEEIAAGNPALASETAFDTDRMLAALARDDAVLLEYWSLDSTLVLFTANRDSINAREIAIDEEELATRVQVALSLIRDPEKTAERVSPALRRLHEILIPDGALSGRAADGAANALPGAGSPTGAPTTLYLVPSGPLFELPFHALVTQDPVEPVSWNGLSWFGDGRVIATLPSSALLIENGRETPAGDPARETDPARDRSGSGGEWVILADPASPRGGLRFARAEGDLVRRHLGRGARLLEGDAATETAFRAALAKGSAVHVAAHGSLDPLHPLYSFLRLAKDDANDGRLAVHELFALRGRSPFVFLSACESGGEQTFGGAGRGNERFGLARGLFAAGAGSMIVTLWEIDDYATSRFVDFFYGRHTEGDAVPVALENTRRRFRERPLTRMLVLRDDLSHPYYWAGFVYYGRNR